MRSGIFGMGHVLVGLDFSFPLVLPSRRDNQTHVYNVERKRLRLALDFNTVDPT